MKPRHIANLGIFGKDAEVEKLPEIPLKDGSKYVPSLSEILLWKHLFPGVDVDHELEIIAAWNVANPAKRKTRRGVRTHVLGWLRREHRARQGRQDHTGGRGPADSPRRQQEPTRTCQKKIDIVRESAARRRKIEGILDDIEMIQSLKGTAVMRVEVKDRLRSISKELGFDQHIDLAGLLVKLKAHFDSALTEEYLACNARLEAIKREEEC